MIPVLLRDARHLRPRRQDHLAADLLQHRREAGRKLLIFLAPIRFLEAQEFRHDDVAFFDGDAGVGLMEVRDGSCGLVDRVTVAEHVEHAFRGARHAIGDRQLVVDVLLHLKVGGTSRVKNVDDPVPLVAVLLVERRRRHAAELGLRRRLLEVEHLSSVASAGVLSASVAHELTQPLGAIQSYAEAAEVYLEADPSNIGRVETILAAIRRDNERAMDIIRRLRGLFRKRTEIELQDFDLNDTICTAVDLLVPEATKRGVELSVNRSQVALPVRADPMQLQQVVLNLALNGMEAMQSCASGKRKMAIQCAFAGKSNVEVQVANSGTGIPQDKLAGIFEPFYTTKPQGTGLGLSISRAIIEAYSGKIWAENRPEGGATFRFTLPMTKAGAS